MLASPVSTQKNGSEATSPGSRRMSVPALRTSMTSAGSLRPSQPCPWTSRSVAVLVDRHAQGAHRGDGGQGVGRAEEPGDPQRTVVHRPEQDGAMRHRLVAGYADGPVQARGGGQEATVPVDPRRPHSRASPVNDTETA